MNGETWKRTDKMFAMAEGLEFTRLIYYAMKYDRIQVLDATPSSILYRITFSYFEKWCDINENIIYNLIRMLSYCHRITVVDHQYETCNYSLVEHIKNAVLRNPFVRESMIFRLDIQNYDAVLVELKKALGICVASNPLDL